MNIINQYRQRIYPQSERISQGQFTNYHSSESVNNLTQIVPRSVKNNFSDRFQTNQLNCHQITLKYHSQSKKIIISAAGLFSTVTLENFFKIGIFFVLIFGLNYIKKQLLLQTAFLPSIILQLSNIILNLIIIFCFVCLVILGFKFLLDIFGRMTLYSERENFLVTYSLFGIKKANALIIPSDEIIRLDKYLLDSDRNSHLEIVTEQASYPIFSNPHFLVTSTEIDWLAREISDWLSVPIQIVPILTEREIKNALCDRDRFFSD